MSTKKGYIYVRENEYWSLYDLVKLGKTENIVNRESTYITTEIIKGCYIIVI